MINRVKTFMLCVALAACGSGAKSNQTLENGKGGVKPTGISFPVDGNEEKFLTTVDIKKLGYNQDPHGRENTTPPRTVPRTEISAQGQTYNVYVTPENIAYAQKPENGPWINFRVVNTDIAEPSKKGSGSQVRTQKFADRFEVEYFGQGTERIQIYASPSGTTMAGTVIASGNPFPIDSSKSKCEGTKSESSDDSLGYTLAFKCSHGMLYVEGESFIPKFNHWANEPPATLKARKL